MNKFKIINDIIKLLNPIKTFPNVIIPTSSYESMGGSSSVPFRIDENGILIKPGNTLSAHIPFYKF